MDNCSCTGCVPHTSAQLRNHSGAVARKQGVITVDVQLLRNGSMNSDQVTVLASAWKGWNDVDLRPLPLRTDDTAAAVLFSVRQRQCHDTQAARHGRGNERDSAPPAMQVHHTNRLLVSSRSLLSYRLTSSSFQSRDCCGGAGGDCRYGGRQLHVDRATRRRVRWAGVGHRMKSGDIPRSPLCSAGAAHTQSEALAEKKDSAGGALGHCDGVTNNDSVL